MDPKVLIALGGNALSQKGEKGTAEEQIMHVRETCKHLIEIVKSHYTIAITHGNGPQVGDILLKNEMAKGKLPQMPLDICGAESQGMIGYMIQRAMHAEMKWAQKDYPVITVFTQTLVDKNDPAFANPSKPIGPYYTKENADEMKRSNGWAMVEQTGKGFRRVVPSPKPKAIIEGNAIRKLVDAEWIVISCGGGGVPVVLNDDDRFEGVEAVIDKDLTAAVLGKTIGAEYLIILTDVEKVAINFGKPDQQELDELTIAQAKRYIDEGQFPKGSMGPKVQAAINFVESGGKRTIITSLKHGTDALLGNAGTVICQ